LSKLNTLSKTLKANRGLTFIELVIVLAVMAVISGSVAFSVRSAERRALDGASRMIQADMRFAQRMAIIDGRTWDISFDRVRHQYTLNPLGPEPAMTIDLPNGVRILNTTFAGGDRTSYTPRGTPGRSGTITLTKGRYTQDLTVVPSGGRVEIKEIKTIGN
jgi:prepilin-type N-terminal cleavage/methylation domain-containing protein